MICKALAEQVSLQPIYQYILVFMFEHKTRIAQQYTLQQQIRHANTKYANRKLAKTKYFRTQKIWQRGKKLPNLVTLLTRIDTLLSQYFVCAQASNAKL